MIVNPTNYNWEFFNSNGVQKGVSKTDPTNVLYRFQGNALNTFMYAYDSNTIDQMIAGGGGSFDIVAYWTSRPTYETYAELYTAINASQIGLNGLYKTGDGTHRSVNEDDIDNAGGGTTPPAPTNGVVDDENKTFTFTESI